MLAGRRADDRVQSAAAHDFLGEFEPSTIPAAGRMHDAFRSPAAELEDSPRQVGGMGGRPALIIDDLNLRPGRGQLEDGIREALPALPVEP